MSVIARKLNRPVPAWAFIVIVAAFLTLSFLDTRRIAALNRLIQAQAELIESLAGAREERSFTPQESAHLLSVFSSARIEIAKERKGLSRSVLKFGERRLRSSYYATC